MDEPFVPENLKAARRAPATQLASRINVTSGQVAGVLLLTAGLVVMIWNGGFGDFWRDIHDQSVPYGYQLTAQDRHDRLMGVLFGLGLVVVGGAVVVASKPARANRK